jgi:hypothetical protein
MIAMKGIQCLSETRQQQEQAQRDAIRRDECQARAREFEARRMGAHGAQGNKAERYSQPQSQHHEDHIQNRLQNPLRIHLRYGIHHYYRSEHLRDDQHRASRVSHMLLKRNPRSHPFASLSYSEIHSIQ